MEHSVRLPLRLAAEPYAKQLSSPSAISLGLHCSTDASELAMLVDDDGIHAFCSSQQLDRSKLLSLILGTSHSEDEQLYKSIQTWKTNPLWLLVRSSAGSNTMQWHVYEQGQEQAVPSTTPPTSTEPVHDIYCAQLITNSIRRYYSQQILEPSVRGFLSVLEKQFAADLYLFELLQNAVDDGASTVRFAVKDQSLQVSHNGRQFTPLDVLGLSSVGLSTKSRQGKRTIGFMGVGFKAVYKRYAKVEIRDGTYSFVYEEPTPHEGGYGWVMLPKWRKQQQQTQGTMCHFSLERPRGGMQNVLRDLGVLPTTAPPLLGRAALVRMEEGGSKKWSLDWNGEVHVVERTHVQNYNTNDASEVVTVNSTDKQGQKRQSKWLFVSHKFLPSKLARQTYLQHTKRSHSGFEEVCGFIDLAAQPKAGRVHSVLPTIIYLPTPMHVQSSWLLSVDRQQVQDLSDNAWNLDILNVLPLVVANFFRWAANKKLEDYTALLPLLPTPTPQNSEVAEMLGQLIPLQGLQKALLTERILPVAIPIKDAMNTTDNNNNNDSLTIGTGYYEGDSSVWVPPAFLKWLKPQFLRTWLGKRPLRTDIMGDAAYHPIFASTLVIGQLDPLPNWRTQLCEELLGRRQRPDIQTILQMMAAIGSAYDEHPDCNTSSRKQDNKESKKATSNNKNDTNKESTVTAACPALPLSTKSWPVFLTENGTLVTVDQVVLPAEDFALVPKDLATLLRPYFVMKEEPQQQKQHSQQQNFRNSNKRDKKNGKHNRGQPIMKSKPVLQRLHPLLEEAIIRIDKSDTFDEYSINWEEALTGKSPNNDGVAEEEANNIDLEQLCGPTLSFLRRVRSEMPSNVTSISSAVTNLLDSYSKQQRITKENIATVLQVAQFALETGNSWLLSFVLVDDLESSYVKLVPASGAYVGKAIDNNGPGSDLERFAGKTLPYISLEYNAIIQDSAANRKKLLKLLSLAGAQTGLSVSVSAVLDIEKDMDTLQQKVIPKLPDKKLPQLRKNATKKDVSLPYGLGEVMDRKKYSLIDAQLSCEWERIINSMSPGSAVGFISLLLAMPVDDNANVSAKNVPAEDTVAGKDNASESGSGNLLTVRIANDIAVPLRSRLYFLPPGQPGAKTLDISEAHLVKQLKSLKWLPCAVASSQSELMSLALLRPEEALLEPDVSRPEMPVVQLPDQLLKRLKSSPFADALTWGTHAPPPPVTELAELCRGVKTLLSSSGNCSEQISFVSVRMISVWTAIARAHVRGGLSASDLKTIQSLRNQSNLYVPVKRVLESRGNSWIVPIDRCLRMPEALNRAENDRDELKQISISSLVASNFMCDFNHNMHNPFFSQPDISEAIINLAGVQKLSDFQTAALIRASGAFIRYCCKAEPIIYSRFSPIRASFSYAMRWCIESPRELANIDGGLKVWVRNGPGVGSKALRRRWISLKNGPVQVVLDDSRVRSALLTPEMGIQLLGVLNHTEHDKDCPDALRLSHIEKEVIKHCGIWRLSDKRFTVKTRARGSAVVIAESASKIQLVSALLFSLGRHTSDDATEPISNSQNGFLAPSYDPPMVIRHDSLSRDFQAPGMDTPVRMPMYAVFGRAPKTNKKCILVGSQPDDYSVELEELILAHCGVLSIPSSQTKTYRAALRLLSHLENDDSFTKFLRRDFADFEATKTWQQLKTLHEAEKTRDVKALRSLLMTAEEMCENESDGGGAVLQSARELLAVLEAEAEAQRTEERQIVMKQLKEAETAKDEIILRNVLIHAEELCEDDSDGGDAILQSARELLSFLEKETKSKLVEDARNALNNATGCGRGRGRGAGRTQPAWMTSGDGPKSATAPANDVDMSEGKIDTNNTVDTGRGRGISNLPAWMTSDSLGKAPKKDDETDTTTTTVQPVFSEVEGAGGKRRISNLPAWMTRSGCPEGVDPWGHPPNNDSDESNGLDNKDKSTTTGSQDKAADAGDQKSVGPPAASNLPNTGVDRGQGISTPPACTTKKDNILAGVAGASSQNAAMGRGRGISNLPAGRKHLGSSLENMGEERPTKKTRNGPTISEYTLRLSIDSACELDFINCLKPKIEEEAKLRGGSATILPKAL